MYACANQGPVSITFRAGTKILKLNAKEYYYSSQLHFVLLPDGYRERLPKNTEKKKEPPMTQPTGAGWTSRINRSEAKMESSTTNLLHMFP